MDLQEIKFDSFEANVNYAAVRGYVKDVALSHPGHADALHGRLVSSPRFRAVSCLNAIAFWSVLDELGLLKGSHFDAIQRRLIDSHIKSVENYYTLDRRLTRIKTLLPVFCEKDRPLLICGFDVFSRGGVVQCEKESTERILDTWLGAGVPPGSVIEIELPSAVSVFELDTTVFELIYLDGPPLIVEFSADMWI